MIRLGPSDYPCSPVRFKEKCWKLHDHFSFHRVTDCLTSRIPSSSITDDHPRLTDGLVGGRGVFILCRDAVAVFYISYRLSQLTFVTLPNIFFEDLNIFPNYYFMKLTERSTRPNYFFMPYFFSIISYIKREITRIYSAKPTINQ